MIGGKRKRSKIAKKVTLRKMQIIREVISQNILHETKIFIT